MSHIKWLQKKINKNWGVSGHISSSTRVWLLRFAKKESRILMPKIYYRSKLPYLKRKKRKIEKYINLP
jgi:hypothetical protein